MLYPFHTDARPVLLLGRTLMGPKNITQVVWPGNLTLVSSRVSPGSVELISLLCGALADVIIYQCPHREGEVSGRDQRELRSQQFNYLDAAVNTTAESKLLEGGLIALCRYSKSHRMYKSPMGTKKYSKNKWKLFFFFFLINTFKILHLFHLS